MVKEEANANMDGSVPPAPQNLGEALSIALRGNIDVNALDENAVPPIPKRDEGAVGSAIIHGMGTITGEQLAHRLVHNCKHCEFTANTEDRVVSHTEHKHRIYVCRFCCINFTSKYEQCKHLNKCEKMLEMREKVRTQTVQIRDRNFNHAAIKCMFQPVQCPICKMAFASMFDLGDRLLHRCTVYGSRLFACSGCQLQFATANGLKAHLIARYNEHALFCFDSGILSPALTKARKTAPRGINTLKPHLTGTGTEYPVTRAVVPIKAEPTDEDEIHDPRTQHALVSAHLLSANIGRLHTEYYQAMRRMFYKINCPYCGFPCRNFSALHSHGLLNHPPHDRCLFQCGGCQATYQTPTGLGQHLKRQFDENNATCYNTVNVVRKEDYHGPITYWNTRASNKKIKKEEPDDPASPSTSSTSYRSIDDRHIPSISVEIKDQPQSGS